MIEFGITGLSLSCIGPPVAEFGPYPTEAEADAELARLRMDRKIDPLNSTVYRLPDI